MARTKITLSKTMRRQLAGLKPQIKRKGYAGISPNRFTTSAMRSGLLKPTGRGRWTYSHPVKKLLRFK